MTLHINTTSINYINETTEVVSYMWKIAQLFHDILFNEIFCNNNHNNIIFNNKIL